MGYGSIVGVTNLIGDIVAGREFNADSDPSINTVNQILTGVDAEINIELKQNGYVSPIDENAGVTYDYLVYINNCGAAARVLSTLPHESYSLPDENRSGGDRRTMLDRELWHGIQRIRRQEFPSARDEGFIRQVFSGSQDSEPRFSRGMFEDTSTDRVYRN